MRATWYLHLVPRAPPCTVCGGGCRSFCCRSPRRPRCFLCCSSQVTRCRRGHGRSRDLCSIYCGAIIALLLATSCYWHATADTVAWAWPALPYAHTTAGMYVHQWLHWLGWVSSPTAALAPAAAESTAGCATCWTDLALGEGRSLFGLTPRPPLCGTAPSVAMDTLSYPFLGIPGTKLGFALDWSVLLPRS